MGVLQLVSTFDWDAKVVLALAAFSVTYGHFGLTVQLHPVNPLAKCIAMIRQLPDLLERTDILKPRSILLIYHL
jgi:Sieve element occlusion N-terminus